MRKFVFVMSLFVMVVYSGCSCVICRNCDCRLVSIDSSSTVAKVLNVNVWPSLR